MASQIAAGLTRELLAYSGKGTVLNQGLDMNQLIQEMLPLFRTSLSVNTVLETGFASKLSNIQGDINQLRQVLLNLVVNANDSLHEKLGSVRITTQSWNSKTNFRTWLLPEQLPEQAILIEVSDTGCGLDEATKRRIFDPFFTTKSNGRGLGLSAVMGIIRAHRGNLAVTSQLNRGTTFSMVLPVSTSENILLPVSADPLLNKTDNVQQCILVIDDNELVRDSVAAVLKSKGYSVILAADGQRGIEIYRQECDLVDLVILDMTMPGLSGEEVFRKLRQIHPQLQIIITTGHSVEDISRKFLTQANVGFVQKASGPQQLLQEVQRLLYK